MKKVTKYFRDHVMYNSFVHIIAGMGLGILVTYPFIGSHPLRWGVGLLVLGLLGHLYPLTVKK